MTIATEHPILERKALAQWIAVRICEAGAVHADFHAGAEFHLAEWGVIMRALDPDIDTVEIMRKAAETVQPVANPTTPSRLLLDPLPAEIKPHNVEYLRP